MLSIIRRDFRRALTLRDLAARVNVSDSRLQHLFRQYTGTSPMGLLRETRFRAAAAALRTTHLRISEICFAVGFSSTSGFTHAFTKRFGMSPSQYRARAREATVEIGVVENAVPTTVLPQRSNNAAILSCNRSNQAWSRSKTGGRT